MPIFTIKTNVSQSQVPADFLEVTAGIIAEVLSKPISYVVVHLHPDQMLSWGGTNDPCAFGTLSSIGNLGKTENINISKKLYPHLKKTLGIAPDKIYIEYVDLKRENVGYAGTTFAGL